MSAVRPLHTLAMISSAVLCQRKGLGSWFQCSVQISMASMRSVTEVNTRGSCLPSTGTYFWDAAGDGGDHRRDGGVNWNGEPNPESQIRSR